MDPVDKNPQVPNACGPFFSSVFTLKLGQKILKNAESCVEEILEDVSAKADVDCLTF